MIISTVSVKNEYIIMATTMTTTTMIMTLVTEITRALVRLEMTKNVLCH